MKVLLSTSITFKSKKRIDGECYISLLDRFNNDMKEERPDLSSFKVIFFLIRHIFSLFPDLKKLPGEKRIWPNDGVFAQTKILDKMFWAQKRLINNFRFCLIYYCLMYLEGRLVQVPNLYKKHRHIKPISLNGLFISCSPFHLICVRPTYPGPEIMFHISVYSDPPSFKFSDSIKHYISIIFQYSLSKLHREQTCR